MNISSTPQLRFPLWKFLNQRVFDSTRPAYLLPHRYWHVYQCQHLTTCWQLEYQPEQGFRNL